MLKKSYRSILLSLVATTFLMQGCVGSDTQDIEDNISSVILDTDMDSATPPVDSATPPTDLVTSVSSSNIAYSYDYNGHLLISGAEKQNYIYTLTDLDNDGDLDGLGLSSDNSNVILMYENRDGTFKASKVAFNFNEYNDYYIHKPQNIYVEDLDGDGKKEIITFEKQDGFLFMDTKIYSHTEPSSTGDMFYLNKRLINITDTPDDTSVWFKDIDRDGDLDFVVTSTFDEYLMYPTLVWNENRSNLNFTSHQAGEPVIIGGTEFPPNIDTSFTSSAMADIDNDGDLDIVLSSDQTLKTFYEATTNNSIWIYKNDNGEFINKELIYHDKDSTHINKIRSADLDNDGDMDIVVATEDRVYWLQNRGSSNFRLKTLTEEATSTLEVADMDGNGNIDIVSCFKGKVAIFKNNYNGRFTKTYIGVGCDAKMELKDIDNDGDLDIFTSRYWFEYAP